MYSGHDAFSTTFFNACREVLEIEVEVDVEVEVAVEVGDRCLQWLRLVAKTNRK